LDRSLAEVTRYWRAALILVVALAAYANSFQGPFVLDDQASVVQNPDIRDLRRLDRVLNPRPDSPVAGRPLVNLTFALDYAIGGLDVTGYHAVNLAWHVACAWLLFGIVRRTLELPAVRARTGPAPADVALAAALLWTVHPLNSEVVDYVTQRTESMMAFCLLFTLYAAIRSHASPRWHAAAIVACLAGTVCKETIAVAPLLVALHDRAFTFSSWREAVRDRRRLYVGLAASWLVLGGLVSAGPRAAVSGLAAGVSVWTYLLNQAGMIVEYLRLTVWPSGLVVFYGWPEMLSLGDVLPQAIAVVVLLAAAVLALVKRPPLGYLGAWFFLTLAPTSSFIPIATEVGAERRMYLPLMALAVLAVVAIDRLVLRFGGSKAASQKGFVPVRGVALAVLVVTVGALGWATLVRNTEYTSGLTLAQTVVERRPSGVAYHILGEQLGLAGRRSEAETALRAAVSRGNSRARYQLGALLIDDKRYAEATTELEAYVATSSVRHRLRWLQPPLNEVVGARLMLADVAAFERRWADVAAQSRQVLDILPRHPDAQRLLGTAYFNTQQWPETIATLRQYLETRPGDAAARTSLGVAFVATDRLDEAVAEFRRAVEADPSNREARRMLQLALQDQRAQRP
jgi:protein O-mannosyl-transferase